MRRAIRSIRRAAIADGVVYVGSCTGDLLALDLATGQLHWKYATGSPIGESSPAVGGDAVFVGDPPACCTPSA